MKYYKQGKDTIWSPLIEIQEGEYITLDEAIISLLEKRAPKVTHKDDENGKCKEWPE